MVSNEFGYLVEELGKTLEMPNLKPDEHGTCLLRFPGQVDIYIEMDGDGDHLIFGCDFGELPPGRYREDLFEAALKSNNVEPPLHGIVAYSKQAGHLVLFERVWVHGLDGGALVDALMPFVAKAKRWKEAIGSDKIPEIGRMASPQESGIFGLKP